MKKICFVVSNPMSAVAFLLPHFKVLSQHYEISVVANTKDPNFLDQYDLNVRVISIPIERSIKPWSDIRAIAYMWRLLCRNQYDAVHSVTPKAGLITLIAAWLAQTPIRIHIFTGQVWTTRTGLMRLVLKTVDKLIVACATHILVDSASQRDFLIQQGVLAYGDSQVLANGSICGVDVKRFHPDSEVKAAVRNELNIPQDAIVLLYLGRLNREKGILDLANAFAKLARQEESLRLMLVGPDEESIYSEVQQICSNVMKQIVRVGFTKTPENYMKAADIFCLPSYREGFGSSVIEAAACGLPTVSSKIYGLTDAVEDEITGLLHSPGEVNQIITNILRLIKNKNSRICMGLNARRSAETQFSQEQVTNAMSSFYAGIL